MVLDFKVERLFVEKQVTFLFLPFSASRSDGTTSPPQRKKQTKTSHAIHSVLPSKKLPQALRNRPYKYSHMYSKK